MENLNEIVREEVLWYAGSGRGANILMLPVVDEQRQTYCVIAVNDPNPVRFYKAGVVVLVRVVDDTVIIEADNTDKPLDAALEWRGIPREKIILAYEAQLTGEAE